MNVIPLCDEVVSAILKRPESLITNVQPRSPRFSSLPDMGHWYVERTETEEPNKEKCAAAEDGRRYEAVREVNSDLSRETPFPEDIRETDITRVREGKTHVD